ncbi:S9 family peptidase [Polaribacter sp. R2A056_3_33]|uniref:alpha/beta hydrolase family protein n=1 Tax=Polaribacter sp. R2A056_3_33 TaxID=2745563 RepID=UPI001C4FDD5E|nr:prolyl oligopeptidase family serine peptidase [Polaribacter sp. R2A056_3_33]QXP71540.1 S9 family peptidase [Polaribacter sp. R2A056_3_33]
MKTYLILIFSTLLLSSCKQEIKKKENFSPLIDYQYLIKTNNDFKSPTETYKIRYKSDGLEITGFLTKPKDLQKYPTIIYNRGGNRDFGTFTTKSLIYQQYLSSNGFIVLSSQLRGNMHSEGKDEFGGKDLNDILKLIEINKSLKYSNQNIGVFGISRGGLNAYQISRLTDEIKAIAVVGAPTDLRLDFDTRPEMYEKVLKELIGDTINFKKEYDYRSPIKWVNEINEPTLILHGSDDWRVKPINAELMIKEMKRLNKEFDFQIVENGDHGLNTHRNIRNEKVINWFRKYLK